jgi:hypothetical protein
MTLLTWEVRLTEEGVAGETPPDLGGEDSSFGMMSEDEGAIL